MKTPQLGKTPSMHLAWIHSPSWDELSPSIRLQNKTHHRNQGLNLCDREEVRGRVGEDRRGQGRAAGNGGGQERTGRAGLMWEGIFRIKEGPTRAGVSLPIQPDECRFVGLSLKPWWTEGVRSLQGVVLFSICGFSNFIYVLTAERTLKTPVGLDQAGPSYSKYEIFKQEKNGCRNKVSFHETQFNLRSSFINSFFQITQFGSNWLDQKLLVSLVFRF